MSSPPSLSPSCCQYLLLLVALVCVQRPSVAGTQEVNSIAFAPPAVTGASHWSNWSAHSPPVLSSLLQQVTGNSMASLHPPQPPLPPTQGPQRYMPGSHLTDRHEMATSHANRNSLFEWPAGVTPGAGLPSSSRTSPPASTCDAEDSCTCVFSGPPGRASSIPSLSPTGTDWHASRSPSSSASCQTTACNWWSCTSPHSLTPQEELVADLISLLASFSGRVYGLRAASMREISHPIPASHHEPSPSAARSSRSSCPSGPIPTRPALSR